MTDASAAAPLLAGLRARSLPGPGRRSGRGPLTVVVFSGGRGSGVLSTQLITDPRVAVTLAINGYDDGASTGEVRRFLGDTLGPSDYRKNASRIARALGSCPVELTDLLDLRLPVGCTTGEAEAAIASIAAPERVPTGLTATAVPGLAARLPERVRADVSERLGLFRAALARSSRGFRFSDCSLGNLVFAGSHLKHDRRFNDAIDDYCTLVGLPAGVVDNVTDGTNAYLVALDGAGEFLATEEAIVASHRPTRVSSIYLLPAPLDETERAALAALPMGERAPWLEARSCTPGPNPRLLAKVARADLIIYAPGTQHSSLFPSYLTAGVSDAIAGNTAAVKLFITNIQSDAEIPDASAGDIVDRALYYMRDRGRRALPTPSLITHFLLNDPGRPEVEQPYVPLGSLAGLEDPRLVRIADYEDGVTGRHDATRVLTPYIASLLGADTERHVAVFLHDAGSPDKLTQTMLEMVRGGLGRLPAAFAVFHTGAPLDPGFVATLPFPVQACAGSEAVARLCDSRADYVILFESSGMYRGEDIVGLASQILFVGVDAIWGSRRLSVRDIEEAYRLRYRHHWLMGVVSRAGSHVLSALYLTLFGRYISDSLSGARAVRSAYLRHLDVAPDHKLANHQLLASLLKDRAELLEMPVRFFPLSPDRVKRTSALDGLRAMAAVVGRRFARRAPAHAAGARPQGGAET